MEKHSQRCNEQDPPAGCSRFSAHARVFAQIDIDSMGSLGGGGTVGRFQPCGGKLLFGAVGPEYGVFHGYATYGRTYGPFGITATRAAGPYSARLAATASSTLGAGST
jgi:hypothetical protein